MNREIQNLLFTIRDDTSRFKYDYGFEDDNKILIKAKIGDWTMLLEEIERLNNIINGMEKFFQYAYDNEVRPLNDRKVSVWTICLDKLQELKGVDKE